jgi:hypothetical protein
MAAKVSIKVDVDPEWIDFVTRYNDIFRQSYIGYWAYGVQVKGGWLVYEQAAHDRRPTELEIEDAAGAYESRQSLPEDWHLLDRDAAIRAWAEGVRRSGVDWYKNGDANDYDVAIQRALLGEVKYG